jgi:hypothetical protein
MGKKQRAEGLFAVDICVQFCAKDVVGSSKTTRTTNENNLHRPQETNFVIETSHGELWPWKIAQAGRGSRNSIAALGESEVLESAAIGGQDYRLAAANVNNGESVGLKRCPSFSASLFLLTA